jgi:Zn-dependent protease
LPLLTLYLSGWTIGYASAPYSPVWAMQYCRRAALMALAGPGANLGLVVISGLILRSGLLSIDLLNPGLAVQYQTVAFSTQKGMWESAAMMLSIFFSLNLLLAVFNLIPLRPLDGSSAIGLVLPSSANASYQQVIWGNPSLQLIGILLAWRLFHYLFDPAFRGAVAVLNIGIS